MAPPDDPIGPPPGPPPPGPPPVVAPTATSRRIPNLAGTALILVAVALAVVFGIARADDPGDIVTEVVGLHDGGARGEPLPAAPAPAGFSLNATRAGWVRAGGRVDQVEGRRAVTVFWERAGRRIAHTTVSGEPVGAPSGARRTGRRGILLRSFDADGRTAVTWTEEGRTAVISAAGVSRAALYNLAGGRPLR